MIIIKKNYDSKLELKNSKYGVLLAKKCSLSKLRLYPLWINILSVIINNKITIKPEITSL